MTVFYDFIINTNKRTSTHFCLRFNPLKLNTKIGNTNRNICSWIFNYHILGCWQRALMSNTCTHNERQTKLFANTNLHLKDAKAVAEQLNNELFSILFLNIYWEKMRYHTEVRFLILQPMKLKYGWKNPLDFSQGRGEFFPFFKGKTRTY